VTPFILVLMTPAFLRTLPSSTYVLVDGRNFPVYHLTSLSRSPVNFPILVLASTLEPAGIFQSVLQLRYGRDCTGILVRFLVEAIGSSVLLRFKTISWIHLAPQSLATGGKFSRGLIYRANLRLMVILRMNGAVPPFPHYALRLAQWQISLHPTCALLIFWCRVFSFISRPRYHLVIKVETDVSGQHAAVIFRVERLGQRDTRD
jgi:hypothetical protein